MDFCTNNVWVCQSFVTFKTLSQTSFSVVHDSVVWVPRAKPTGSRNCGFRQIRGSTCLDPWLFPLDWVRLTTWFELTENSYLLSKTNGKLEAGKFDIPLMKYSRCFNLRWKREISWIKIELTFPLEISKGWCNFNRIWASLNKLIFRGLIFCFCFRTRNMSISRFCDRISRSSGIRLRSDT